MFKDAIAISLPREPAHLAAPDFLSQLTKYRFFSFLGHAYCIG
jgi:hypothetical protein